MHIKMHSGMHSEMQTVIAAMLYAGQNVTHLSDYIIVIMPIGARFRLAHNKRV